MIDLTNSGPCDSLSPQDREFWRALSRTHEIEWHIQDGWIRDNSVDASLDNGYNFSIRMAGADKLTKEERLRVIFMTRIQC